MLSDRNAVENVTKHITSTCHQTVAITKQLGNNSSCSSTIRFFQEEEGEVGSEEVVKRRGEQSRRGVKN